MPLFEHVKLTRHVSSGSLSLSLDTDNVEKNQSQNRNKLFKKKLRNWNRFKTVF